MTLRVEPVPTILLIGHDPELLAIRAAVLQRSGLQTRLAAPESVEKLLADCEGFPVAIFCTTLRFEENEKIAARFRQHCPATKLLLLLRSPSGHQPLGTFDGTMEILNGPMALVSSIRKLLPG